MSELDIWRAANILLKRYKTDAVLIAAKRADALLEQGDTEGCGVWIFASAVPRRARRVFGQRRALERRGLLSQSDEPAWRHSTSGLNLTFESRKGFPIARADATLAYAYGNFHHSYAL